MNTIPKITISSMAMLASPLALAHEGVHHHATWFSGLLHPFTGADHLLAMILMGGLAALLQSRQANRLLMTIAVCFIAGVALGTQLTSANLLEPVLYGSVVALPLFAFGIIKRGSLHLLALIAVAAFGASHGVVLGTEAVGSVALYGIGATISSFGLCSVGFVLCRMIQIRQKSLALRVS